MAPFNSDPNLVVVSAVGHTRQIPIPVNGIVLGRDARLGPPFSTDEFVSRNHASVQRHGDGVEIADLGSANGTYVNGALVHAPAPMRDGDVLRVGHIELKLTAPTRPPGAAAVSYRVDRQYGQISETAATETKARWLIGTVLVSFVVGFAIFALGAPFLHALATIR